MLFLNSTFDDEMASRSKIHAALRSGHLRISSHGPTTELTMAFERQDSASSSSTIDDPKTRNVATVQQNDTADNSSRPQTAPGESNNSVQFLRQPVHSRTSSE